MKQANEVKLVIFDVDGVMTDGGIIVDDNGVETRKFDIKDGLGVIALQLAGIETAIITSKKCGAVRNRAEELKIKRYFEGVKKKTLVYDEILKDMGISDKEVCYVGDDLVDLGMLKRVGMPVAVADAVAEAKEAACYITKAAGGRGAVREVCELILKQQGKWDALLSKIS